ncbi:MAG TPA: hypothetical protein VJ963_14480 [Bacteroidales bacterium]|nr:hypothetical protein [Bacteroidales bacterium]
MKYILVLLFINILVILTGYLLTLIVNFDLKPGNIAILSLLFSVIAMVTFGIFMKGQSGNPQKQTLHSLVAFSLKFLLEIGLALIWFIVAKKNSLPSLLSFFVIYLTLTLYSIYSISKTLKNRSL